MKATTLLTSLSVILAVSACGGAKNKPAPKEPEPSEVIAEGEGEGEGEDEEAQPKQLTQEEIDAQMAPPEGLIDLRPLLGTDPNEALPAVFAKLKKGTTAKEMDAEFPGVGAVPKIAFVTFTKAGNRWVRVKGNQPHKEVLDIAYEDDGGLKRIAYMFDPKIVTPELWDYLKKAAALKWGETDMSGDLITWKPDGIAEFHIHKTDEKNLSFQVAF